MKIKQFMHEYSGFGGVKSECRLAFYKAATGVTVAIADELPINTGTPIREFCEHLATQAYRMVFAPNGTHVKDFLYIEHGPTTPHESEYSYSLVEFDWEEEGEIFIHPQRTILTEEEVRELVGGEL